MMNSDVRDEHATMRWGEGPTPAKSEPEARAEGNSGNLHSWTGRSKAIGGKVLTQPTKGERSSGARPC